MIKSLTAISLLAALLCLLYACGEQTETNSEGSTAGQQATTPTSTEGEASTTRASTKQIEAQTVEAGCQKCTFSVPGAKGCPAGVRIDGKALAVSGIDVNAHKIGLCSETSKQAVVSGTIENGEFVATAFELVDKAEDTEKP